MSSSENNENCDLQELIKNQFFSGKLMTADHFNVEQKFIENNFHTINKFLHGMGIVQGLSVKDDIISLDDLLVKITPGLAIDCCGQEIIVPENMRNTRHEISREGLTDEELQKIGIFGLYIKFKPRSIEPAPSLISTCSCQDECAHNKTKETFEIILDKFESSDVKECVSLNNSIFTEIKKNPKNREILTYTKQKITNQRYKEYLEDCNDCNAGRCDSKILLAVFKKDNQNDKLKLDAELSIHNKKLIFSNKLLLDLFICHIIENELRKTDALKSINRVKGKITGTEPEPNLTLESGDNSLLSIQNDLRNNKIILNPHNSVTPVKSGRIAIHYDEKLQKRAIATNFGPFKHGIDTKNPPAIILARTEEDGQELYGMEDDLLTKERGLRVYKPVRINNKTFEVQISGSMLQTMTIPLFLRFYAIPAITTPKDEIQNGYHNVRMSLRYIRVTPDLRRKEKLDQEVFGILGIVVKDDTISRNTLNVKISSQDASSSNEIECKRSGLTVEFKGKAYVKELNKKGAVRVRPNLPENTVFAKRDDTLNAKYTFKINSIEHHIEESVEIIQRIRSEG